VNGTFIDAASAQATTTRTIATLNGAAGGSVILNGTQLTVTGGGTFAGTIADGTLPGSLWVDRGTLALAGANSFTGGTTVNTYATLNVTGFLAAGSSLDLFGLSTATLPGASGANGHTQQLGALTIGSGATVTVEPSVSAAHPAVLQLASIILA